MNTILIILGAITAAVLLLFIGLLIFSGVDLIFQRYHEQGEQAQWEKDRRRLHEASYWFSEDPATKNLIAKLAENTDIGTARDTWRKERNL